MKSKITKVVIIVLLLFSAIGFLATNSKLFQKGTINEKSQENGGENDETKVSSVKSSDDIKEEDFYKEFRRLDTELFMSHQVGKIGDKIRYYNDYFENDEGWIQVESCEIIKEISDELSDIINNAPRDGVNQGRTEYGEESYDLSEGHYSILKIKLNASYLGIEALPYFYSFTRFQLYSTNQKGIFGEGTLVATDNLEYVGFNQVSNQYRGNFVFKSKEDTSFQMLYLVPDRLIEEGGLYIGKIQSDDYLSNAWKYDNSTFVIHLNIGEE